MLIHLFTGKYLFWVDTLQEGDVSAGFSKNAMLKRTIRSHFGDTRLFAVSYFPQNPKDSQFKRYIIKSSENVLNVCNVV